MTNPDPEVTTALLNFVATLILSLIVKRRIPKK